MMLSRANSSSSSAVEINGKTVNFSRRNCLIKAIDKALVNLCFFSVHNFSLEEKKETRNDSNVEEKCEW
jgi:hypothetical protein